MLKKNLGWFLIIMLGAIITIWIFSGVAQVPTLAQHPPRTLKAEYEGKVIRLILDSGELVNTSKTKRLLYRLHVEYPDSEATLFSLTMKGTELGTGSFIRLRYPNNSPRDAEQVVDARRLAHWDGFVVLGNPTRNKVVVELWGGANTRNRLRIEEIGIVFFGRPKPDKRSKNGLSD